MSCAMMKLDRDIRKAGDWRLNIMKYGVHTRKRNSKKSESGYVYEYYFWFENERYSESGFKNEKNAKAAGRNMLKRLEIGKETEKKYRCPLTFSEVAKEYVEVGMSKKATNTKMTYQAQYNKVDKYIGKKKLYTIDYKTLQPIFNNLGMSHKEESMRVLKAALKAVFDYAIKVDYIDKNPVLAVDVSGEPSEEDPEKCIEKEDFDQLYDRFASDDRFNYRSYGMALLIGYYTGLRKGEVFGLLRKNVDLKKRLIYVRTQLQYVSQKKNGFIIKDVLKTKGSRGIVPIPNQLYKPLKKWLEEAPKSDVVICDKDGNYMSPIYLGNIAKKWAKEIGFEFTFHSLRHSYATNLVMNDVNIKIAQKLLRHKNPATTLRIYTHAKDHQLVDTVSEIFG